ncbi:hypothetical protein L1987_06242 [Smallanthus sonchifolius]|uniref:Uncharacterized protein n=1 Tax=Smallanthus sonchifolius TaxID=185202 RepID=A0ACB9JXQ7_9ASTR|nr:hypothetical protein L1987_06242 [Smallanthus sonchifolius]
MGSKQAWPISLQFGLEAHRHEYHIKPYRFLHIFLLSTADSSSNIFALRICVLYLLKFADENGNSIEQKAKVCS